MKVELRDILKQYTLKVTPVRLQVLEVLVNSKVALSHADVTEKIADDSIDKVTLYRTLNIFHEKGLIHKVANEDRNWLYALHLHEEITSDVDHNHAHFICDTCDKIFCFDMDTSITASVNASMDGFLIKEKEIRLHGLCPTCQ